jgi:hypothetical protein
MEEPLGLNLFPDQIKELIPRGFPPPITAAAAAATLRLSGFPEDYDLQRSLLWSIAAQEAFEASGLWLMGHFLYATYGFTRVRGELFFGVTVWTLGEAPSEPQPIRVGDEVLPVTYVQRSPQQAQHSYASDHPCRGTTTCVAQWADDAGQICRGLVTAGHVAQGLTVGDPVDLAQSLYQCNATGTLTHFGLPRVDACVIGPSAQDQQQWLVAGRLHVSRVVAPGTVTTMRGQAGGVTNGVVAQLSNPGLSVDHNYRAVEFLVLLDKPGRPGDSGALVRDRGSDSGLGLYLGDARDVTGALSLGRCQLMRQVELVLNVDLFEPA